MTELETLVLAHRYIYYVLNDNLISDFEYDALERQARATATAGSVVHSVGSSLASSYPGSAVEKATELMQKAGR